MRKTLWPHLMGARQFHHEDRKRVIKKRIIGSLRESPSSRCPAINRDRCRSSHPSYQLRKLLSKWAPCHNPEVTRQQNGLATRSFSANCRTSRAAQKIPPTFFISRLGTRSNSEDTDSPCRRNHEIPKLIARGDSILVLTIKCVVGRTRYYRVCLAKFAVSFAS